MRARMVTTSSKTNNGQSELGSVKSRCPAFETACPYKTARAQPIADLSARCPGFSAGCPFKDVTAIDRVFEMFEALSPETHGSSLPAALKLVHEVTAAIRKEAGHEACPVFSPSATGCPFKTLTLSGQPLVRELEASAWSRLIAEVEGAVESDASASCPVGPLSTKLKLGTKDAHRKAENVHFVREFIKGRVEKPMYMMMIKDLYHVYVALEEAAEANRHDPLFGPMHYPLELSRVAALSEDMKFYFGPDFLSQRQCEPSAAAAKYIERIRMVSSTQPSLLIAHSYTRYLGDLSGGRVLMRVAIKTMKLDSSGDGVRFYEFDNVADPRAFKKQYRAGLDQLPISAKLATALVEEANQAFLLNMDLFRHLDEQMGLGAVPVAPSTGDPNKCPFINSARNASGADASAGAPHGSISNCPVHWSFYARRPWILQVGATLGALGAAYWAAGAMGSLTLEL